MWPYSHRSISYERTNYEIFNENARKTENQSPFHGTRTSILSSTHSKGTPGGVQRKTMSNSTLFLSRLSRPVVRWISTQNPTTLKILSTSDISQFLVTLLSRLHKNFVIVPADKASNNYTFVFKWKGERSDTVLWQKPLHPQQKSKEATWQHKNATKNFDNTTIADRLRTVSWRNSRHPTEFVKPVYERSLTATAV